MVCRKENVFRLEAAPLDYGFSLGASMSVETLASDTKPLFDVLHQLRVRNEM